MSGNRTTSIIKQSALAAVLMLGASQVQANDNGTAMTAGLVMEKVPDDERFYYVTGIIEGLAYARFLKDTEAAGENAQSGMNCIYNWFYDDGAEQMLRVEAAFTKYPEHYPSVLLSAMIKRKCGG